MQITNRALFREKSAGKLAFPVFERALRSVTHHNLTRMSLHKIGYPFPKLQIFRLVQIESICRQQNKWKLNIEICNGKGRKHCGKWRKCWLPAFSPFPTMFSKAFCLRVVKSWVCVVKRYLKPTQTKSQIPRYNGPWTSRQLSIYLKLNVLTQVSLCRLCQYILQMFTKWQKFWTSPN